MVRLFIPLFSGEREARRQKSALQGHFLRDGLFDGVVDAALHQV